jgi:hypothetical protein
VLENQPTADCKRKKYTFVFYPATIIQENLLHFPEPIKNSGTGTIPITTEYHQITSV